MRVKYKLIKDLLIREDDCLAYLEKMSLKGWRLVKIGTTFFKFKKQKPQRLKYQFDYNLITDEYLESLLMDGYHFIDNYREIALFYNENVDAVDLQSDQTTRLMALKQKYKITFIILMFIGAIILLVSTDEMGVYSLFVRDSWGSILINLGMVISHYLCFILAAIFILDGIAQLMCRWSIARQLDDKSSLKKWIRSILFLEHVIVIIGLIMASFLFVDIAMNNPIALIGFGLWVLVFSIYGHYINKKVYLETDETKKRLKIVGAVVLVFVLAMIIQNIDFNGKPREIKSYQTGDDLSVDDDKSLIIKHTGVSSFNSDDVDFYESFYQCINDYVARYVFEESVCLVEHDSRIPTSKEIDEIVEKTGSWSTNDVQYLSYKEAIKKFNAFKSSSVDQCYYLNDEYVAIKDNLVLRFKVKDNVDIEQVLLFYFK